MFEEFGNVIAEGGSAIVIASQSGHHLPALSAAKNKVLATTPVENQWPRIYRSSCEIRSACSATADFTKSPIDSNPSSFSFSTTGR